MKEIHTEVEINAAAEKVWRVLTEFADYREWNPFVRRVEREVRVGARVHVDIQPSGGRGLSFRPTILVANPNRSRSMRFLLLLGSISALWNQEK
jgi:uncharacterized protein YndB with AHSA1/START domain